MGVTDGSLWREPKMAVPPNPGKIVATYVGHFEARRYAKKFSEEGRNLEIWSVRPHLDDIIRDGHRNTRYDLFEVECGGVQWLEPPNFYDWPWGGHIEHQGTPWSQ